VIGDNPGGPGQIELRLLNGLVVSASTIETVDNYAEEEIGLGEGIDHIVERDNWDHNKLDQSREEVVESISGIIESPHEVYESADSETTYYIKEIVEEGDEVIAMVIVAPNSNTAYQGKEIISGYVPAGGIAEGSEYNEVYDRDSVIQNTVQKLQEEVELEKIEEQKEIIEEVDLGDVI